MSIAVPQVIEAARGSNAIAFVPGGELGFNMPVPFTIAPFAVAVTPNMAAVSGWRSFAISCSADNGAGGGTHVFMRIHDPSDPATVIYRREIGEFITEDGHQQVSFAALTNKGQSQSGDDGILPHLVSFEFDNLDFTNTCTVTKFDGLWCSAS